MSITYDKGRATVTKPHDIGPRLIPSLKLSDGSRVYIHPIGRDRTDGENRVQYEWIVDGADGGQLGCGQDLHSGAHAEVDVDAMYSTFASFVDAWIEAIDNPGSDNKEIFPAEMQPWAEANYEELRLKVGDYR